MTDEQYTKSKAMCNYAMSITFIAGAFTLTCMGLDILSMAAYRVWNLWDLFPNVFIPPC